MPRWLRRKPAFFGIALAPLVLIGAAWVTLGQMDEHGRRFFETGRDAVDTLGELARRLKSLDPEDVQALEKCGAEIRGWIGNAPLPKAVEAEIRSFYQQLIQQCSGEVSFAVRSSATAEDLPGASFAGQQETYLNVRDTGALLAAVRKCWASLWTARALAYRRRQSVASEAVSLAVVVQRMEEPSTGAGEEVMGATAAAVANAVFDATGVRLREYPMTPERVLAALGTRT